ncbi:MAG: hypothetical protein WD052_08030 [Bacteroidales bacterium]
MIGITSCDFLGGSIDEADLVGTWNIDDVSAEISVAGINITQFLIATYEYSSDSAEAMMDSLVSEFSEGISGTITFSADYNYVISGSEIEGSGTWSLDTETDLLSLQETGDTELEILTVETLNATTLIVTLPAEDEELDLNGDGEDETTVDISIVIEMSKEEI